MVLQNFRGKVSQTNLGSFSFLSRPTASSETPVVAPSSREHHCSGSLSRCHSLALHFIISAESTLLQIRSCCSYGAIWEWPSQITPLGLTLKWKSVVSDSLRPRGLYSPWNSPGQNTGVDSRSLLQGIFPIQELNPGLPHCRRILYHLSHQGSWSYPEIVQIHCWRVCLD